MESIVIYDILLLCRKGNPCEKLFHDLDQGRVTKTHCLHLF